MPARSWLRALLLIPAIAAGCGEAEEQPILRAVRLNGGEPIVHIDDLAELGLREEAENVNGPSVIRLPDWIPPARRADPEAVYYLYFAHHRGSYLRMAWSSAIEGPWELYRMGPGVPKGRRGVLDLGERGLALGGDLVIPAGGRAHIASPAAWIDHANRCIVLLFHANNAIELAGERLGRQVALAAAAPFGLDFARRARACHGPVPAVIGSPYLRPFAHRGLLYAVGAGGKVWRPRHPEQPFSAPKGWNPATPLWEPGADAELFADLHPPDSRAKHPGVVVRHPYVFSEPRGRLWVAYTLRGRHEADGVRLPEQILVARVDPAPDGAWRARAPRPLLRARPGWECGELAPAPSKRGSVVKPVNQLRDPHVFSDADGSSYLFYVGCGEDGIGVARLEFGAPPLDQNSAGVAPERFQ